MSFLKGIMIHCSLWSPGWVLLGKTHTSAQRANLVGRIVVISACAGSFPVRDGPLALPVFSLLTLVRCLWLICIPQTSLKHRPGLALGSWCLCLMQFPVEIARGGRLGEMAVGRLRSHLERCSQPLVLETGWNACHFGPLLNLPWRPSFIHQHILPLNQPQCNYLNINYPTQLCFADISGQSQVDWICCVHGFMVIV